MFNWFDRPYWRCQKYEMRLLNDDESLELFRRHAFQYESHHEGYDQVVKYCEGNPLALEVLGSSMSNYNAHMIIPSQLRLFEIDMDSRIQSVLIRSYKSLPCNTTKELFLHIACFFVGMDIDYVVKILEPDYAARSGVETLLEKCLLSVSPYKKLIMHRLLQEMAKNIVRQESTKLPAKRSRIWLSSDSYKILSKGKGSETIEGFALDMKLLQIEDFAFKSSELKTDALRNMEILKLLQLNFAELSGSYEYVSENLRWLCCHGFHLTTIPSDLYMGNLVAIDMSYSKLEVFEPPMVLQSLKILNLKDSHNLSEIRNIFNIPGLETLVLWNCYSLVNVCKTVGDLTSLVLLNMTGCKNLFNREQLNLSGSSTSGGVVTNQTTFSFPFSLHQLFLKDCHLVCTDSFPLSFSVQPYLQYLNLCNSLFESLPRYNHLENLRVLDLSFCYRLKCLLCLPSTLAELYIYYCESLEKITFQSHRFPLDEFGYQGCVNLYEIEGYIKLVPIANLDETDLGHMKWLKEYQNHQVCLVGDDELTVGRSWHIQMLYEFNIMSISMPDLNNPNMTPNYRSESSSLSFDVPSCPKNKWLKGINVTFKYSTSGDDWAWFCKVSTSNGVVDLMYNPKVFGKPEFGEVCIWLSYWPIGNTLDIGDTVNVSIVVMSGLEVHECGVSLVYSDQETLENNMGWTEILGGDLSGFELSTGVYYLCRHDFFELMEVGRLTPDWFKSLVGDTIDYTEVRGWRKTGRPKQVNPSFTELKTIRCIIRGPQLDDMYNIPETYKSSIGNQTMAIKSNLVEWELSSGTRTELTDETMAFTSSLLEGELKSGTRTELSDGTTVFTSSLLEEELKSGTKTQSTDETMEEIMSLTSQEDIYEKQKEGEGTSRAFGYDETKESDSSLHDRGMKKIVFAVNLSSPIKRLRMMMALRKIQGIRSNEYDRKERKLTIIGDFDYLTLGVCVRKIAPTDLLSVGPASEKPAKQHDKPVSTSGKKDKSGYESDGRITSAATGKGENLSSSSSERPCRLFTLGEIQSATNNFAVKIGVDYVYKGQISSKGTGYDVAIKQFPFRSRVGTREFMAEIETLFKFHHRHVVSLIGYCYDGEANFIVYEYMPNGSLYHHLHDAHTPLSWMTRLKIAIGAAHGLDYLHTGGGAGHGVIHRGVNSRHILLDENWEAVISGFGLSIIGPTDQSDHVSADIAGTLGYLDPEVYQSGQFTYKSDVYSFGVVLLELISGRRAVNFNYEEGQVSLVEWAQECVREGKLEEMVDSDIKGTISTNCLIGFARIAVRCVHNVPEERPTMSELVTSLQHLLELQEKSNPSADSSGVMGQSGTIRHNNEGDK